MASTAVREVEVFRKIEHEAKKIAAGNSVRVIAASIHFKGEKATIELTLAPVNGDT